MYERFKAFNSLLIFFLCTISDCAYLIIWCVIMGLNLFSLASLTRFLLPLVLKLKWTLINSSIISLLLWNVLQCFHWFITWGFFYHTIVAQGFFAGFLIIPRLPYPCLANLVAVLFVDGTCWFFYWSSWYFFSWEELSGPWVFHPKGKVKALP